MKSLMYWFKRSSKTDASQKVITADDLAEAHSTSYALGYSAGYDDGLKQSPDDKYNAALNKVIGILKQRSDDYRLMEKSVFTGDVLANEMLGIIVKIHEIKA